MVDKSFKPQVLTVKVDGVLIYGEESSEQFINLRKEAEQELREMGVNNDLL